MGPSKLGEAARRAQAARRLSFVTRCAAPGRRSPGMLLGAFLAAAHVISVNLLYWTLTVVVARGFLSFLFPRRGLWLQLICVCRSLPLLPVSLFVKMCRAHGVFQFFLPLGIIHYDKTDVVICWPELSASLAFSIPAALRLLHLDSIVCFVIGAVHAVLGCLPGQVQQSTAH